MTVYLVLHNRWSEHENYVHGFPMVIYDTEQKAQRAVQLMEEAGADGIFHILMMEVE